MDRVHHKDQDSSPEETEPQIQVWDYRFSDAVFCASIQLPLKRNETMDEDP